MKNIKKIILVVMVVMASITSKAQLPLKYGDGVITHSNNYGWNTGGNEPLVRVIHTSNTVTAPLNAAWIPPSKPLNNAYPNWKIGFLGNVFGITLDGGIAGVAPNIYVSSTQIYGGSASNFRKIYRLDGNTGAHSLVYDFNNPTGTGSITSIFSLGNLKYLKTPTTENIYVSDWQTGEIKRVTGNSSGAALWTNQPSFTPKFGKSFDDVNEVPYGLAIRHTPTGLKLYYSKVFKSASYMNYGTCEIYCINLNPDGSFGTTETQSLFTGLPLLALANQPISDIDFSSDGTKMLVSQQSWVTTFGVMTVNHNTKVLEFIDASFSNTFSNGSSFESGTFGTHRNATGGVSYSNNKLLKDSEYGCDSSVYFTSDAIDRSIISMDIYGVMGYPSTGGTCSNAIWIDGDDNYLGDDKEKQGDVEIYKNPNACAPPCNCGTWQSIQKGADANYWVNTDPATIPTTITWMQGAALPTDPIIPHYVCTNTCEATYTYALSSTAHGASPIPLTANASGSLVLSSNTQTISNLPCGAYFLTIIPRCGTNPCPPVRIPIVIQCPPPCSTCSGNAEVSIQGTPTISAGTVAVNYTLSNSTPVTEVRVSVEDFRVINVTGNENCLLCQNQPKSWGSIQTANLVGVTNTTVLSSDATIDNREVVFKNTPLFNLTGNVLTMNLALPQTTGLSCCTLKAEVCIKVIIRDSNCCEREITKCFSVDLK